MSAAATAAGYLYASGRLRGRGKGENDLEHPQAGDKARRDKPAAKPRRELRVAVVDRRRDEPEVHEQRAAAPKRTPKIEYRTRRWRPAGQDHE